VPFLVFAIGVSHGAQKMNGIMQDVGRGTHKLVAARYTFRRLFLAGLTALLADAVGFAVLMVIDIPVIRDLALTASIGVAVLIFTNLILLPVLLSYIGVSETAAERSLREHEVDGPAAWPASVWDLLERFTERRWATSAARHWRPCCWGSAVLRVSLQLKIGDLDAGARPNCARLALQPGQCLHHAQLLAVQRPVRGDRQDREGRLHDLRDPGRGRPAWPGTLQQVPGVQTTIALPDAVRRITAGSFEGNPKWLTSARNQDNLNYGLSRRSATRTCSTPSVR
jgi:hypothetical protein